MLFRKFGKLMRCKTVDPETVVGAGGGVVDPPIKEPVTAETAMKKLSELTKAVQDDKITKEKFIEVMGEVQESIKELRLDAQNKMRYDVGATKAIAGGDIRKAFLAHTKDPQVKALQDLSDDIHIAHGILANSKKVQNYDGMKSLPMYAEWEQSYGQFAKAMDTATAGEGLEWVPDAGMSAEMQYAVELEARVYTLFPTFEMPQSPFKHPLRTSVGQAYRAVENTNLDSLTKAKKSEVGTKQATHDAEDIMARVGWSGQLDMRAVVAMLPEIKKALVVAHANAKDQACIDGQITAVIDTGDSPAANSWDVRNLWDGIRYYTSAGVNNKLIDLGSAWNVEGLNSLRKLLGKAGMKPLECAWIPGISSYYNLLTIKDNQNNNVVLPLEAYGGAATILTGELGKLFGIPIVPSEYIREDLNASGIYDGVTETKTVLPIVHRKSWKFGTFGPLTVRSSDEIHMESFTTVIVTHEAADFQAMFAASVQVGAATGYNIAP
jgi:hypothetical protein